MAACTSNVRVMEVLAKLKIAKIYAYFSRNFIVLILMFGSVIHSEFIAKVGDRGSSSFF